jgi:hypothetical protein
MQISYAVERNRETKTVDLLVRFVGALPEVYKDGRWVFMPFVTSIQQDGRLEDISEAEALHIIEERESRQPQVA